MMGAIAMGKYKALLESVERPPRGPTGCVRQPPTRAGTLVNDVHSQLNLTRVERVVSVDSITGIQATIRKAQREGKPISIAGSRHAMGGQQFGTGTILIDTSTLNRVLDFDPHRGIVEVEAGIEWPELMEYLVLAQRGRWPQWGIAQKQTGADTFSIGGSLAANVHGRGLLFKPIIQDVESFVLVNAEGNLRTCSRRENPELFRLVIGGYGLFGIIATVKLRLTPRTKLERVVEITELKDLIPAFERRAAERCTYGDFQYSTETDSDDFLWNGVFSCYRPVDEATPIRDGQKELSVRDWTELIDHAHTAKGEAFRRYADHYLATSGQIYWSDTHQLSTYLDDYHRSLDRRLGTTHPATEIITEIYVPRQTLVEFMDEARDDFRKNNVNIIYGTIRLIERDDETFLAWAKQPYACIIFNVHTVHTRERVEHSAAACRRLTDMAMHRGGSYYLTYHKFATRKQVLACYPQFPEFLRLKQRYDPEERFQSDWYRHYRRMFTNV
ncbi:MAG: FAD-binding oxidoreductase [Candidatus Methylomirabilales bacterium]